MSPSGTAFYSRTAVRAFELWFRPWLHSRVHVSLQVEGTPPPAGQPVILAANHVSWFDGFLLRELHRRVRPGAPLYTLMGAAELERRPLLRLLGVYPLAANTRGVLRAVRVMKQCRNRDPEMCVAFFPQGAIWPSTRSPLGFHRGIELLADRLAPCAVLPVAIHIEPLNRVRPTAFVRTGTPLRGGSTTAPQIEAAVARALDDLQTHLRTLGEAAVS